MTGELSLEEMGTKINDFTTKLDGFIASYGKKAEHENEKNKEHEAALKKAQEEKEEEKREAKRAKLEDDIHDAMDEDDHDKKEAAIKKAMDEYSHGEDKPKTEKHEATTEEKEEKEHVAAIIKDKKLDIDKQILQAAIMSNPAGIPALKTELEKGTYSASIKMYDSMKKMFGENIFQAHSNIPTTVTAPPPFFMASSISPESIDTNQLNASSPAMDFSKLSSKDLLDGKI